MNNIKRINITENQSLIKLSNVIIKAVSNLEIITCNGYLRQIYLRKIIFELLIFLQIRYNIAIYSVIDNNRHIINN